MNELHAAQERIVKLEQEIAEIKEQNYMLEGMILSHIDEKDPPIFINTARPSR